MERDKLLELTSKLRNDLEKCRYKGINDTHVMDAIVTLNNIETIILNHNIWQQ